MGTKYHVNVITSDPHAPEGLQAAVERRLAQVNRHLSTWIEDSEISRFNRFHEVGAEFPISEDFRRVMTAVRETYIASAGAWDATVGPLVDLWGFGPAGPPPSAPSAEQIAAAMALVGFNHIEIRAGSLVKQRSAATLDLSSIAKGYGVDAVVELLHGEGFSDFLVEIGGEVYAVGRIVTAGPGAWALSGRNLTWTTTSCIKLFILTEGLWPQAATTGASLSTAGAAGRT